MPDNVFFDTNVLIYAVAEKDRRSARAEELLAAGGLVSVQVLNEFVSVARSKLHMPWKDVLQALEAIRVLCPSPVPITVATHEVALRISQKQGYSIYDALIAAAALQANCVTLYSEDLQDGHVISGKLRVRNPFR
ncbi:MAG TPA: PIN domain-containing protein [Candidatus Sulfotelmatobacter sp.]